MTQDRTEIQKTFFPNQSANLKKITVFTRIRKSIAAIGQLAAIALSAQALALDLHVSPAGKDTNLGTEAAPIASLSAARDAGRAWGPIERPSLGARAVHGTRAQLGRTPGRGVPACLDACIGATDMRP